MTDRLLRFLPLLVIMLPAALQATPLVEAGQLVGATDVEVDGTFYDVNFVSGSCIAIFSGCDETSDFLFQSSTEAVAAGQALLDYVFVDGVMAFDTQPGLTKGCAAGACFFYTPYSAHPAGPGFAFVAMTHNGVQTDYAANSATGNIASGYAAWAVWTPAEVVQAPEPGTVPLMVLAMGVLALTSRRRFAWIRSG